MSAPAQAILHPHVDALAVGLLSLLGLGLVLVFSSLIPEEFILQEFLVLTILLNGTHFMASYRLLYSSREQIFRYRWASMYLPALLVFYSVVALAFAAQGYTAPCNFLLLITGLYLALHYTGQTWGMMASYAYLERISFTPFERNLFRTFIGVLTAWQVVWTFTLVHDKHPLLTVLNETALSILDVAIIGTFLGGVALFLGIKRRTGRIPARIWIPFVTLHVWYFFLTIYPKALFWVQLSHAIQYLSFPYRVELNRAPSDDRVRHMITYFSVLAVASFVVFYGFDKLLNYPDGGREAYTLIIVSCINIHHYFIDGCIWKISNPIVKDGLFKHLQR